MSKRFTDTDKWKREWFMELKPHAKLAWLYLLDQCDYCGIWPRNFRLMSDQLGFKIDHQTLTDWFGDKVIAFDSDKYFVASFFEYQYGEAKEGFRAKQSAAARLIKLGLMDSNLKPIRVSPDTQGQSPDYPSIVECIVLDSFEEGVGETFKPAKPPTRSEWESLAKLWPRSEGRTEGVNRLAKRHKTREALKLFENGLRGALARFAHEKTELRFVPHFSTFVGTDEAERWKDTVDWKPHGTARISAAPKEIPADGFRADAIVGPQTEPGPRTMSIADLLRLQGKQGAS